MPCPRKGESIKAFKQRMKEQYRAKREVLLRERAKQIEGKYVICFKCGSNTGRLMSDTSPRQWKRVQCPACRKEARRSADARNYPKKIHKLRTDPEARKRHNANTERYRQRLREKLGEEEYKKYWLERAHRWRQKCPENYRALLDRHNSIKVERWASMSDEEKAKHNEQCKKWYRKDKVKNPDRYLRTQALAFFMNGTDLKAADIPKELIEAKVTQIKNFRLLKGRPLTIQDKTPNPKTSVT